MATPSRPEFEDELQADAEKETSTVNLKNVSEQALKDELSRRQGIRCQKAKKKRDERIAFLLTNIDALLLFVPEHGRTSCSDANLANRLLEEYGLPRCVRCFLLYAKDCNYWDPTVNIEDITLGTISLGTLASWMTFSTSYDARF